MSRSTEQSLVQEKPLARKTVEDLGSRAVPGNTDGGQMIAPWSIELRPNYQGLSHLTGAVIASERELIAEVAGAVLIDGQPCVSNMRHARLIAAAPDLLKAAKRALNVLKAQGESVRPGSVLGALDAAICKAKGEGV